MKALTSILLIMFSSGMNPKAKSDLQNDRSQTFCSTCSASALSICLCTSLVSGNSFPIRHKINFISLDAPKTKAYKLKLPVKFILQSFKIITIRTTKNSKEYAYPLPRQAASRCSTSLFAYPPEKHSLNTSNKNIKMNQFHTH